jgi:hypothetical protein
MFSEAKQLVLANASSSNSAIAKLGTDLSKLKNDIDSKIPYDNAVMLVDKTIQPSLKMAFNLR